MSCAERHLLSNFLTNGGRRPQKHHHISLDSQRTTDFCRPSWRSSAAAKRKMQPLLWVNYGSLVPCGWRCALFAMVRLVLLLWPPYVIGQTIIFLPCGFFFFFYLFSSPNLSGCRLNVYHTSTHGVALVRIYNAGLKCAACGSLEIQDAKKSPFCHHRTTLSGYIFGTGACIDNRKKTC